jgi:hypothetical protein
MEDTPTSTTGSMTDHARQALEELLGEFTAAGVLLDAGRLVNVTRLPQDSPISCRNFAIMRGKAKREAKEIRRISRD